MIKNELKVFNYQSSEVRTVEVDGEPWFVLKDVCAILNIENHKDVVKRLDADEVGRFNLPHPQNPDKLIEMVCIKVGRLAKAHNLKTDEYGEWFKDKSKGCAKEIESFRYYETIIPVLRTMLQQTA